MYNKYPYKVLFILTIYHLHHTRASTIIKFYITLNSYRDGERSEQHATVYFTCHLTLIYKFEGLYITFATVTE